MAGDKGSKVSTKKSDKKVDKKVEKVDKKAAKAAKPSKVAAPSKSSPAKNGVPLTSTEILKKVNKVSSLMCLRLIQCLNFALQKHSKKSAKEESSSDESSSEDEKPAPKVTKTNGKVINPLTFFFPRLIILSRPRLSRTRLPVKTRSPLLRRLRLQRSQPSQSPLPLPHRQILPSLSLRPQNQKPQRKLRHPRRPLHLLRRLPPQILLTSLRTRNQKPPR